MELRQVVEVQEGVFTAGVPAAPLDLRVAAEGWAPLYRWGWNAAEDVDLGPLLLRRGGSLAGFVMLSEVGLPAAGARVRLQRHRSRHLSAEERQRQDRRTHTGIAGERGFFQVSGLPAGQYRLNVEHADTASVEWPAVVIEEGSETFLQDAIQLPLPISLRVRIEPVTGTEQSPWYLHLIPSDGHERRERTTDHSGSALFEGLDPGDYRLRIFDSGGSLMHQDLVVLGLADQTIHVELPLIRVEGRVRLSDEPLTADIELQTGEGDVWRYQSDENGFFAGLIRRPNRVLFAAVRASEPEVSHRFRVEDFRVEDDLLELDLDLPAGRLTGFVVDGTGSPVARAGVEIRSLEGDTTSSKRSDDDGRFAWEGLPGGTYSARASLSGRNSAVQQVAVDGDGLPASVTLTLRRGRELRGILIDAEEQPVAGADLHLVAGGRVPARERVTTDVDGSFSVVLPEAASRAVVQALAPRQVAWSGCVSLPEDGVPWTVRLPPGPGGAIRLISDGDPDLPPTSRGELMLMTADGGFLPVGGLDQRQAARGGPVPQYDPEAGVEVHRFDHLTAGRYAVTYTELPWWTLADSLCAGGVVNAEWGWLSPGGDLQLVHDHARHQRAEARDRE